MKIIDLTHFISEDMLVYILRTAIKARRCRRLTGSCHCNGGGVAYDYDV